MSKSEIIHKHHRFPSHPKAVIGYMAALCIGNKGPMSEDQWKKYPTFYRWSEVTCKLCIAKRKK